MTIGQLTQLSGVAPLLLPPHETTFTLVGKSTRYTYRSHFSASMECWIIEVLYGAENSRDYRPIAYVSRDHFILHPGGGFTRPSWTMPAVLGLYWAWKHLVCTPSERAFSLVEVWHSGNCSRCGRLLTTPESIALGLGPTCATMGAL